MIKILILPEGEVSALHKNKQILSDFDNSGGWLSDTIFDDVMFCILIW